VELPGLRTSLTDRVAAGIMIVLIVGNAVGISLATWIVARYTRAHLDEGLSWTDGIGMSMLGGIGFTVSLLIGQLAFGFGTEQDNHVEVAVLVSPVIAAMLVALVLRARERVDRRLQADDLDNRPEPTNVGPRADHGPPFARCVCRRIR
jgi:NhaA family Na+:H+ antiporter